VLGPHFSGHIPVVLGPHFSGHIPVVLGPHFSGHISLSWLWEGCFLGSYGHIIFPLHGIVGGGKLSFLHNYLHHIVTLK
jgi:hypothetical protein